ncbi:MAG TPA: Crp/Fnr family transcriptional regulator [Caulobacteraceae bacterium]
MAEVAIDTRNRLLSALRPDDLALLAPHLSPVSLKLREMLEAPNTAIEHVYFVETGIVSVVAKSKRHRRVEAGLVGWEGMTGLSIVMADDRSPNETYVQAAGSAHRLSADHLRQALATSALLQRLLLRYAQAFLIQTAQTALTNGTAKIEERLARWILMSHDRLGDDLPLTHEFLAVMLGVRRPGVTDALHRLEGRGLIRTSRGQIRVTDRPGIIVTAGGSYGVPEAEYERLLGV